MDPSSLRDPACPPEVLRAALAGRAAGARAALANPSAPAADALAAARRLGARGIAGSGSPESRLAWTSAVLEAHPDVARVLSGAEDAAVRRAVLRLPGLPLDVAAEVVATRRSGLHTLARNPDLPLDLAGATPSKRRRRAPIEELVGDDSSVLLGDGSLHARAVELGSGTLDLVLTRSPELTETNACALAGRTGPPADGWVLAALVERFGEPVWEAARPAASPARRAAAADHSPLVASLRAARR